MAQLFGNTVVYCDRKGQSRSVSVGDVALIWVPDRFASGGKAKQFVEVAAISNGEGAGDPGDICYYYRNENGEPDQDMQDPVNIIEVYRKVRL